MWKSKANITKCCAQVTLSALWSNLTRVINIVGIQPPMAAIGA
jgi:hypothetical protein